MRRLATRTLFAAAVLGAALVARTADTAADGGGTTPRPAVQPTFHSDVAPLLKRKCLTCHGGDRPKGRFSAESFADFRRGGKRGETFVPGKPAESLVYLMVTGERLPRMPPKSADVLGADEIATLREWIESGAAEGVRARDDAPYSVPPEPTVYSRPPVVASLAFSRDGARLFVGGYREVLVHGTAQALAAAAGGPPSQPTRFAGEAERIQALAVSADDKLLAAAGGSPGRFGEVQLWDSSEGRLVAFARPSRDVLYALAFAGGAEPRLAVAGTDRTVRWFRVPDLTEIGSAEVHADWVLCVAASSDGARLFTGGRDRTVRVLEAGRGELLTVLATLDGTVTCVAPQPGGDFLLVVAESRQAILYSQKALKEARVLEGQPGAVLAAAFSRDGRLAALVGAAGELRVYQAADGKLAARFAAGEGWNYAVDFSPDGRRVAVAGYDGQVRFFDVEEEKELGGFVPVPLFKAGGARDF